MTNIANRHGMADDADYQVGELLHGQSLEEQWIDVVVRAEII